MPVKISELPSSTELTSNDVLPVVDDSSLTTKKITASKVLNYITGSTFDTLNVNNLTGTIAEFTQITASSISASEYQGLVIPPAVTPGGVSNSVQFNDGGGGFDGSSNFVWDYSSESLGVGTPNPGSTYSSVKLDVSSNSDTVLMVRSEDESNESGVSIVLQSQNSRRVNLDFNQGSTDEDTAASFSYSGGVGFNDILTINGNGGVGINKILPNAKLDVDGDAIVSGNLTVTGLLSGTTAQFTAITSSDLVLTGGYAFFHEPVDLGERIGDNAYLLFNQGIDKLVAFPGLYVTGAITASTALSSSNIGATTAVFSVVSASIVSASSYVGPVGGTPGATNTTIQFNSGSTFSGSTNLVYNYTNNTLSGTIAEFTSVTASNICVNGNTVLSGSVLMYGTASLSINPTAAYIYYDSSTDVLRAFPGLNISGSTVVTGNLTVVDTISASHYEGLPTSSLELTKLIVSSSVSLTATQRAVFATNNQSSSFSITLPSVSLADSKEYYIIKADSVSGSVIVSASSPNLINGNPTFELNGPYQSITLIHNGTDWFIF